MTNLSNNPTFSGSNHLTELRVIQNLFDFSLAVIGCLSQCKVIYALSECFFNFQSSNFQISLNFLFKNILL